MPTVSFRFGKLRAESLCLGASPSRSWLFAVWLHGRDVRATAAWLAGGKGAGNLHMRRQKSRVEVRRSNHGRDARATAGTLWGPRKKECLFLTNEANMLLKTKDRKNEQSRTKPIISIKLLKTKENGYEQSHYVVENKGLGKLTKPNNPKFIARKSFAEKRRREAAATSN